MLFFYMKNLVLDKTNDFNDNDYCKGNCDGVVKKSVHN